MKIQTDFGRTIEKTLREEIAIAGIHASLLDVVESQTNTYAVAKLQLNGHEHEVRLLREEGTSAESIASRIKAWLQSLK